MSVSYLKLKKSDDFELFWEAYPKKEGKGTAEKAWQVASKQKDFPILAVVLKSLDAYKKTPAVEKGFIKNLNFRT